MDATERPVLMALVGYVSPSGEYLAFGSGNFDILPPAHVWPKTMSLQAAIEFQTRGCWVLVDPGSETDLALWENAQRSLQQEQARRRRKWLDRYTQ